MIKIETLPDKQIDCLLDGAPENLFVEYNSATVGMIKHWRSLGHKDKDIKDLLLGNVDIAFRVIESDKIKEIRHGQKTD